MYICMDTEVIILSRFIELYDISNRKILINIDKIMDVYCDDKGRAIITLGVRDQDDDYYYTFPDYEYVSRRIMGLHGHEGSNFNE